MTEVGTRYADAFDAWLDSELPDGPYQSLSRAFDAGIDIAEIVKGEEIESAKAELEQARAELITLRAAAREFLDANVEATKPLQGEEAVRVMHRWQAAGHKLRQLSGSVVLVRQ